MRAPTNILVLLIVLLLGWTCAAEDQGDAAQSIEKTAPPFETEEIVGRWVSMWNRYDSSTTTKGPVTFVYVSVENEYRIAHVHFANY